MKEKYDETVVQREYGIEGEFGRNRITEWFDTALSTVECMNECSE